MRVSLRLVIQHVHVEIPNTFIGNASKTRAGWLGIFGLPPMATYRIVVHIVRGNSNR